MSEFIGVRKFCDLCKHSQVKEEGIICNNKNSKFNGLKVNEVLCAPCIEQKEIEMGQVVETVSFD